MGWSKQEVANKVDWEGGVIETWNWGLRAKDIDDLELSLAWADLADAMEIIDKVYTLLPEPKEDWDDADS